MEVAATTDAGAERTTAAKAGAPEASPWTLFLGTLTPMARTLAMLLSPVRDGIFAEELRVFGRLAGGAASEDVAWVRSYLSHPRYRQGSLLRRLGLRSRVSLLDAWARRVRDGAARGPGSPRLEAGHERAAGSASGKCASSS